MEKKDVEFLDFALNNMLAGTINFDFTSLKIQMEILEVASDAVKAQLAKMNDWQPEDSDVEHSCEHVYTSGCECDDCVKYIANDKAEQAREKYIETVCNKCPESYETCKSEPEPRCDLSREKIEQCMSQDSCFGNFNSILKKCNVCIFKDSCIAEYDDNNLEAEIEDFEDNFNPQNETEKEANVQNPCYGSFKSMSKECDACQFKEGCIVEMKANDGYEHEMIEVDLEADIEDFEDDFD
jgi:hypothetical protein